MRRKGLNFHGMTPQEAAVMDRWDAGMTIEQIVAQTGKTRTRVRQIVCQLDVTTDRETRRFNRDIVKGSTKLGAALRAYLAARSTALSHGGDAL